MSGKANTPNTPSNITEEEIHQMLVDDKKRNDFGLFEFLNPYVQVPFERAQEEYKKKYRLKEAYMKQEFLRKMRTDIKREYLTRKKQLKRLQTDAAVAFREAETKLQEHYSEEFARIKGRRAIDIDMPLVSCVEFREGETIDLKKFNMEQEFGGLLVMQKDIYHREREGVIQFMRKREEEEEELLAQQQQQQHQQQQQPHEVSWSEWVDDSNDDDRKKKWEEEELERQQQQQQQQSSCVYPDNHDHYRECDDLGCQVCRWVREQREEWDQQQRECGDGDNDASSYDSDYCAEFGYYPREYNYERQMRDDEEARVAQAARLRAEHAAEAARLQQQNKRPIHVPGCVNPRCVSCCWDDDRGYDDTWSDNESDDNNSDFEVEVFDSDNKWNLPMTEEEKKILENGEEAQRQLEESLEDLCVSGAHITIGRAERLLELLKERAAIEEQKAMEIPDCPPSHDEPTPASASTGGGMISAQKKAAAGAAAKAAKARQVKQQQKRQQKKYVPLQITDNTNRSNEVTAILTANKLEINLPKKKLQNATCEAIKRHNKKWNRVNALAKQSGARGTKVATLPDPRPWHNNNNDIYCYEESD